MSFDPAAEAARRALVAMPILAEQCKSQPILNALVVDVGNAAARRALQPIRELCEGMREMFGDDCEIHIDDLAPHIYPEDEL